MIDPHTAQGVGRMLPGTIGGQSRVASPITIIRRRSPALPGFRQLEVRFDYTGAEQTYEVPDGYDTAAMTLVSPTGGTPRGSAVIARGLAVTAGMTFAIYCGGLGGDELGGTGLGVGGFNGGGDAAGAGTSQSGWGGYGATDVRLGGSTLADRIAVAGGPGGGAYGSPNRYATNTLPFPSAGGDPDGYDGDNDGDGAAGYGATQLAGGAAGATTGWVSGTAGALGVGGDGGEGGPFLGGLGGGGGGGYYGGGGGAGKTGSDIQPGAGGGGGSSWADGGLFGSIEYSLEATPTTGIVIITLTGPLG